MPRCFLDHLVVAARSLEAGAAFVRGGLGVAPQPGGEHARMATHNLLLRLGEARYLEVIAPNPAAPPPARARWFGLDAPPAEPLVVTWVVRCGDIRAATAAATEALGRIEAMRRGTLDWLITVPADGSLPLDGIAPALIEWRAEPHPAAGLQDRGLSLAGLELLHPDPQRVLRLLGSLDPDGPVSVVGLPAGARPRLVAHIDTPHGRRVLSAAVGDHALPGSPAAGPAAS